jgi:cytochrome c oxidase cbb3-type subunit III
MPAWERRFDDGTLRALAYYVHQMGGGEADASPAPAASLDQGQDEAPSTDATR